MIAEGARGNDVVAQEVAREENALDAVEPRVEVRNLRDVLAVAGGTKAVNCATLSESLG